MTGPVSFGPPRPKPRPRPIAEKPWETHKGYIYSMYISEAQPLWRVAQHMKEQFGFSATLRQYDEQFRKWGFCTRRKRDKKLFSAASQSTTRGDDNHIDNEDDEVALVTGAVVKTDKTSEKQQDEEEEENAGPPTRTPVSMNRAVSIISDLSDNINNDNEVHFGFRDSSNIDDNFYRTEGNNLSQFAAAQKQFYASVAQPQLHSGGLQRQSSVTFLDSDKAADTESDEATKYSRDMKEKHAVREIVEEPFHKYPEQLWNGAFSSHTDNQQLRERMLDETKSSGPPIETQLGFGSTVSVATGLTRTDSSHASRDLNGRYDLNKATADMHLLSHSAGAEDNDDAMSTYSDDSIATSIQDDLVHDLSKQLAEDLGINDLDTKFLDDLLQDFESSLLDFSLRLWHENATAEGRAAVKFVHKNRRKLAQSFFKQQVDNNTRRQVDITYSESEDEKLSWFPGQTLSMLEKIELWEQNTIGNLAAEFGRDLEIPARPADERLLMTSIFNKYYTIISQASSYRWLRSTMLNRSHLLEKDTILMQSIKSSLLDVFPCPKRIDRQSVPTVTRAVFKVHWPLRHALRNSTPSQARPDQLGSILTLTGDLDAAQALTCSAYLEQTWPTTGTALFDLVLKAVQTQQEQVYARDDGTRLTIYENGRCLFVAVEGSRGAAAELGQQLCWLSAALQSPLSKQQVYRATPRIHHLNGSEKWDVEMESRAALIKCDWMGIYDPLSPALVFFAITVDLEPLSTVSEYDPAKNNGGCWVPMFNNVTMVNGYPIRRRKQSQKGLEAPLNVIAFLLGTDFADRFDGKLFIKGHSSMLVSSGTTNDLLLWHYCRGKTIDYISYFDHAVKNSLDFELERLPVFRHIVGWCEEADFEIGSSKLHHTVEWSRLRPLSDTDPRFVDEGHLFAPIRITEGRPFVLRDQNQCANSVPEDYPTIFRRLSGKFALLWDVDGQRGWLINILAVLLHLIRSSLQIDQKLLDGLFILKPEDLTEPESGPGAARKFLSNGHNLRAKVSVSKVTDTLPNQYEILESRMVRFYHTLNEALDYQKFQCKEDTTTSRYLRGWDFRSIASQKGSSMRSICIPAEGKGWAELLKVTGAVTLFGNGFGELISASSNCESLCKYWRTLPTDKYYVAISAYDLNEMAEAFESNVANDPKEFIPNMLWYSPHGQNNTCGCDNRGCTSSCLVQVLLPKAKRLATLAVSEQVEFGKFTKGAFVFGDNENVTWQWQDEECVQELSEEVLSKVANANRSAGLSKDSGYETMDVTSSVDALSGIPSNATSENQRLNLTRSNDTSTTRPSPKVYSSASFNGGQSHLGDNLGDRYENCQFNFGAYQPGPYQPQPFPKLLPSSSQPLHQSHFLASQAFETHFQPMLLDSHSDMARSSQHSVGQSPGHTGKDEDESMDELRVEENPRVAQSGLPQKRTRQQRPRKRRKRK